MAAKPMYSLLAVAHLLLVWLPLMLGVMGTANLCRRALSRSLMLYENHYASEE